MESHALESTCETVQVRLTLGESLPDDLAAHLAGCSECRQASNVSRLLHGALGTTDTWKAGDRVLDQYEVLERLGEGGQGTVYKARDLDNRGLTVALKVARDLGDEFINAIGITHPNVCRIYHAKTVGPFRVIVMEYVAGGTLADRLAAGPLPLGEALALFRGICEGVRAAHAANVRHLDLKPSNVLIRDGVVPIVSDFGLASISGAGARGGTSGYMAPEQERGAPVDQRADVFALGVLLADLLPTPSRRLRAVIEGARKPSLSDRTANVAELLRQVDRAARPRIAIAVTIGTFVCLAAAATGAARAYRHVGLPGAVGMSSPGVTASAAPQPVTPPATPQTATPIGELAVSAATSTPTPSPRTTRGPRTAISARNAGVATAVPVPVSTAATNAAVAAVETPDTCNSSLLADCKRLCDLDDAASCHNAGVHIYNNFSDPATASKYFKRGCDGNFAESCVRLGILYEEGHGVSKDVGRSVALFRRACDFGDAVGCDNLGAHYGNGEGVAQDLPHAVKLFERACAGGAPSGCGNLGLAYGTGRGVAKDPTRAKEFFKRACRADTDWCDDYRKATAD